MTLSPTSSRGSGGLVHSVVGTSAAGSSFDNPGAAAKWYWKSITLAADSLVTAVLAQVKGDATNGQGMNAGVWTNVSTAPGLLVAIGNGGQRNPTTGTVNQGLVLGTSVRQLNLPIGAWLTAGVYWFGVWLGSSASNSLLLAYNSGTGTDQTMAGGLVNFAVDSPSTSVGSNDFCIAASILS